MCKILLIAQGRPALIQRAKFPKKGPKWVTTVRMVSMKQMIQLNTAYRKKTGPTDILSFEAPEPFRSTGMIGELVICLPVLKRQARELGHSCQVELDVLLVHGVLHLLGMDHELGPRQAAEMARWEGKILNLLRGPKSRVGSARRGLGLIERAHSGI